LEAAVTALTAAKTLATDAETARDDVVKEASRLESGCLCRIHKEQKAAWAEATSAAASHAADWKSAHEIICALDKTTTCTVPTCPTLTKPTLAAGVSDAACLDVTFTNCGNTGTSGPSQAQCDAAYDFTGTKVTAGYQRFTVTEGGSYTIEAQGAAGGGHGGGLGGYGAIAKTTVTLTAGDVLLMVVGQKGGSNPSNTDYGGAGGGGTFVARIVAQGGTGMTLGVFNGMRVEPLVIAGGGSGMSDSYNSGQAKGGRTGAGDYTTGSTGGYNTGGGGWLHQGYSHNLHTGSFISGMTGVSNGGFDGGFGGGGAPYNSGGGGGGYDGGDCGGTDLADSGNGGNCFGGSSLNGVTANSNTGHGSIHLVN
jgi:hypothetical protein